MDNLEYIIIEEGLYFGEADLINSQNDKRLFTSISRDDTELLALSLEVISY